MASSFAMVSIFVFDLIAVGLAFAAERQRSKATVQQDPGDKRNYCVYESDIASGFGTGALLFLLLSQLIVVFGTKCFCCGRALRPGGARACALILYILCWLTFIIAEVCLLAGTVRNAYHTKYRTVFSEKLTCQTLRKGVFAAGAAFALFTWILSELYFVCFASADRPYDGPPKDSGIGMPPYRR